MLKSLSLSLLMIAFSLYGNAQIADPNMGVIPAPRPILIPGAVALEKGLHKIEIRYFQRGGQPELKILREAPRQKFADIPSGSLFR